MAITILRRHQVESKTGLARATIYERIRRGTFPAPVPLGARAVGWIQSDIEGWLEDRVREGLERGAK